MTNLPVALDDYIPGSKYFRWYEALWLNTVQAFAVPSQEQIENIKMQAKELDRVRAHFNAPIYVTSWLRPDAYNSLIGGAPLSRHRQGLATDFVVVGLDIEDVKDELMREGRALYRGRGEIDTNGWIHLDLGPGDWFYARTRKG